MQCYSYFDFESVIRQVLAFLQHQHQLFLIFSLVSISRHCVPFRRGGTFGDLGAFHFDVVDTLEHCLENVKVALHGNRFFHLENKY